MTKRSLPALAAAGALLLAGVADAQTARSVLLTTGTAKTAGTAQVRAKLTFPGQHFQLNGTIDDRCDANRKGDGYGAQLSIIWRYADRPSIKQTYGDFRGCTATPQSFGVRSPRGVITSATLILREYDPGMTPQIADVARRTLRR